MGEERIKRRRFLADLLFAGGALTAAALAARSISTTPPSEPQVMGGTTCPSPIPADPLSPTPADSGALGGFVTYPESRGKPSGSDQLPFKK